MNIASSDTNIMYVDHKLKEHNYFEHMEIYFRYSF